MKKANGVRVCEWSWLNGNEFFTYQLTLWDCLKLVCYVMVLAMMPDHLFLLRFSSQRKFVSTFLHLFGLHFPLFSHSDVWFLLLYFYCSTYSYCTCPAMWNPEPKVRMKQKRMRQNIRNNHPLDCQSACMHNKYKYSRSKLNEDLALH